jgi:starch synthase
MQVSLPETDTNLYNNYNVDTLKKKLNNFIKISEDYNFKFKEKPFCVCIMQEITDKNNGENLIKTIKGLLSLGFLILIRARATKKYQEILENIKKEFPENLFFIEDKEEKLKLALSASDLLLQTQDNNWIKQALKFGVIPVCQEFPYLKNYQALEEKGNSFLVKEKKFWHLFAGCVRAYETYQFPYDWKTLQKNAMEE